MTVCSIIKKKGSRLLLSLLPFCGMTVTVWSPWQGVVGRNYAGYFPSM